LAGAVITDERVEDVGAPSGQADGGWDGSLSLIAVRSTRGAQPVLPPVGFSGPPPEPGVPVTGHRLSTNPFGLRGCPHAAVGRVPTLSELLPTLTGAPRIRLLPASTRPLRQPGGGGLPPPLEHQLHRGGQDGCAGIGGRLGAPRRVVGPGGLPDGFRTSGCICVPHRVRYMVPILNHRDGRSMVYRICGLRKEAFTMTRFSRWTTLPLARSQMFSAIRR
jgi:hypothetical protein